MLDLQLLSNLGPGITPLELLDWQTGACLLNFFVPLQPLQWFDWRLEIL